MDMPTTKPRHLAARVLSLLAADYLMRPGPFVAELTVCAACKAIEFDPKGRRTICHRHRTSGVFAEVVVPPRSFFPEGA